MSLDSTLNFKLLVIELAMKATGLGFFFLMTKHGTLFADSR